MSKRMPKGNILKNGEVLARAKNRHEERTLNLHLKHLHQEHHVLGESLAKEKQYLLQIRRNTFKTSGRSPVVEELYCGGNVPICKSQQLQSKHFRKPWAFTFTETSYNAVYNDPFDPYMYRRSSAKDSRSMLPRVGCKSAPSGSRQGGKSPVVSRPKTSWDQRNNTVSPVPKRHVIPLQTDNVRDAPWGCADRKEERTDVVQYGTQRLQSLMRTNTGNGGSGSVIRRNRKQRSLSVTKPCKQDSDAVKMLHHKHRSHSVAEMEYGADPLPGFDEVDFSNPNPLCSTNATTVPRSVPEAAVQSTTERINSNQRSNRSNSESHDSKKASVDISPNFDAAREQNGDVTICDENVKSSVDIGKDDKSYILFKGKRIYNYVRPQDRYRQDPFKEVRRESLVRKISLENPIFLSGYRESSFNYGINFPKAARDRALRQMVETNTVTTAERKRLVFQNASLQRRVESFCQSIYQCNEDQDFDICIDMLYTGLYNITLRTPSYCLSKSDQQDMKHRDVNLIDPLEELHDDGDD